MSAGGDTICAVATPPGVGGIGIVRVSGPAVRTICTGLTGSLPAPRHAVLSAFRAADGELIDSGIVLYFPAPHSFTGEDVLELQGHGGSHVLGRVLQRVRELGARDARLLGLRVTDVVDEVVLAPDLLGAIAVAAYSYMALVPIIQPPIMNLLTTKKERMIRMDYAPRPVSRRARVLFPIVVTVVVALLVPAAAPLTHACRPSSHGSSSGAMRARPRRWPRQSSRR